MRNDNYIDFGEEISRTVKKVLNSQDFYDLRNTINRTMRNVPGMGGGPFFEGPLNDDGFPRLSKEDGNDAGGYRGAYGAQGGRHRHRERRRGQRSVASILFLVFGFIGAIFTGISTLIGIVTYSSVGNFPAVKAIATVFGVLFLISLALIIVGFKLRKRMKRFQLYQKVMNGRTYCMIKELSAASGEGPQFIIKDLRKMIKAGLFAEGYLDEQETCLMTDYQTYAQYLKTMKNAKEQQEAEKREQEKWANREGGTVLKETIDEGKNYIQTIKAANDALPEAEISEKLDQLETVTTEIFDYVEQHPEKLPEIRKFMCYYMPITLKLVTAYQTFDEHGANSEEVMATKLEIKGTLDTINKAYQNLMNKLMQADILDVSSDISALETILAQEGLTEDELTSQRRK
jgi:5-bromo-4-chloroindolyl phosphate hydrolysis protein.